MPNSGFHTRWSLWTILRIVLLRLPTAALTTICHIVRQFPITVRKAISDLTRVSHHRSGPYHQKQRPSPFSALLGPCTRSGHRSRKEHNTAPQPCPPYTALSPRYEKSARMTANDPFHTELDEKLKHCSTHNPCNVVDFRGSDRAVGLDGLNL
jgi:hypothetical protein